MPLACTEIGSPSNVPVNPSMPRSSFTSRGESKKVLAMCSAASGVTRNEHGEASSPGCARRWIGVGMGSIIVSDRRDTGKVVRCPGSRAVSGPPRARRSGCSCGTIRRSTPRACTRATDPRCSSPRPQAGGVSARSGRHDPAVVGRQVRRPDVSHAARRHRGPSDARVAPRGARDAGRGATAPPRPASPSIARS